MLIIWRGMDALRRFENWAAPLVSVGFLILLGYVLVKAGGFGPILSEAGKLGWGTGFWPVFAPSLMAMIAFWSTLSLNMPDFTRFGGSQRKQFRGQILGLPTTMSFISIVAILTTSGALALYGEAIWDPAQLAAQLRQPGGGDHRAGRAGAGHHLGERGGQRGQSRPTTSPTRCPKRITFRTGGLITGVIGVLIQPWRLISDPHIYIFTWLGFYGGVLGAVAGVLVAGYWVIDRTQLRPGRPVPADGRVLVHRRLELAGVVATVVGALLAVGGAYSAPGTGPFPADGLIPLLKPLYDYSWVVGFVAALRLYLVLPPHLGRAGRHRSHNELRRVK